MCTAISWRGCHGRTLDLDRSYGEEVVIMPRSFPRFFRFMEPKAHCYAMAGTATVFRGTPLYYDGFNEAGLFVASLNFPNSARYVDEASRDPSRPALASFEVIPWLLSCCGSVREARSALENLDILGVSFAPELPASPLHFLIADGRECLIAEPVEGGLKLYDNDAGVMTNEPPYPFQRQNLNQYLNCTPKFPESRFAYGLDLNADSLGMGGLGLPGDCSSMSRFVRAAFQRGNASEGGCDPMAQLFHMFSTVEMVRGCTLTREGREEYTVYTAVCQPERGLYCWRTEGNPSISAVDLNRADLDGRELVRVPMRQELTLQMLN